MALSTNLNKLFGAVTSMLGGADAPASESKGAATGSYDDEALLALWDRIKRESVDTRWIWERQWQRNLWYLLGRQWIEYLSQHGGWREKRMAPTVPRPVTNVCKDTLKAIRAIFTAINLGVNVRPNGNDPKNVSAASTADELSPAIEEAHGIKRLQKEFDFWMIVTGNAFYHVFADYDLANGRIAIEHEACVGCGETVPQHERLSPTDPCKTCGGVEFEPAMDEATGEPLVTYETKARPKTIVLSPLEVAFPNSYGSFAEVPYVVRLRWRTKWYFEQHPTLKALVPDLPWSKTPTDRALMLKQSLANHNDLGIMPAYLTDGSFGQEEDGITEYEVQLKPCDAYPEGLVFRVLGDKNPIVLHLEETENVPGPLPYTDADGRPLFTWTHAAYEEIGGRVLGSGPIDLIIQKQDQLNQLDSLMMMTMSRLAAGGWIIPKGSEVENVTKLSQVGVIVRWNPLTVQGNAKPERFEGAQINGSWFTYREQIISDIEKLTGTYDVIKGSKPSGVEAFSALQLMVEQGQSSFSTVFSARGEARKDWYKFAIELEREFGPDERTLSILSPARKWTFKTFQRAKLSGSVSVIVEDGSNTPKTSLGMRASVQQAQQLGMLDMKNPDTLYSALKLYGLQQLVPGLDTAVQAALHKQESFENWIVDKDAVMASTAEHTAKFEEWTVTSEQQAQAVGTMGAAPTPPPNPLDFTPLKWLPWYHPGVHRQEFEKWANSDRVRELIAEYPAAEQFMVAHYQIIKQAEMQAMIEAAGPQQPTQVSGPGGASVALENSNRESTEDVQPKGTGQGAQNAGPR